jgi:cysteine dioxygenase
LARLAARARSTRSPHGIESLLEDFGPELAPLSDLARHSESGYVRHELVRDDDLLIVLIAWLPGQRSAPHDHGGSSCALRVLSGVAEESRYERVRDRSRDDLVEEVSSDQYVVGSVLSCDGEEIHSLGAPATRDGGVPLVTLHIYQPAPSMREFRQREEESR